MCVCKVYMEIERERERVVKKKKIKFVVGVLLSKGGTALRKRRR